MRLLCLFLILGRILNALWCDTIPRYFEKVVENQELHLQFDCIREGCQSRFDEKNVRKGKDNKGYVKSHAQHLDNDQEPDAFPSRLVIDTTEQLVSMKDVDCRDDDFLNCEAHNLHLLHSGIP